MRRSDREVWVDDKIDEIINECKVLRVAFYDNGEIYIVPVNFGLGYNEEGNRVFYVHGANEGRKMELLKSYPTVGFELDCECVIEKRGELDCNYTSLYKSIIGTGTAGVLETAKDKKKGLDIIMQHYTDKTEFFYSPQIFAETAVWVIEVDKISCKVHE